MQESVRKLRRAMAIRIVVALALIGGRGLPFCYYSIFLRLLSCSWTLSVRIAALFPLGLADMGD